MPDEQESPRPTGRARIEPPDLSEKGGLRNGEPQRSEWEPYAALFDATIAVPVRKARGFFERFRAKNQRS